MPFCRRLRPTNKNSPLHFCLDSTPKMGIGFAKKRFCAQSIVFKGSKLKTRGDHHFWIISKKLQIWGEEAPKLSSLQPAGI